MHVSTDSSIRPSRRYSVLDFMPPPRKCHLFTSFRDLQVELRNYVSRTSASGLAMEKQPGFWDMGCADDANRRSEMSPVRHLEIISGIFFRLCNTYTAAYLLFSIGI